MAEWKCSAIIHQTCTFNLCVLAPTHNHPQTHLALTVEQDCLPIVIRALAVPLLLILPFFASLEDHCTALGQHITHLQPTTANI
jgi:hypothetical protein